MNEDATNKKGPRGDSFEVAQSGDRSIAGKEITIVEGNVYKFANASPEAIDQFRKIVAMPTEVSPGQAAGLEGSKTPQDIESLRRSVDEVLELLRASRKPGQSPGEIQAGEVRLSRVDLLLKKAVLLTTEADQMVFDHLQRHKREIDKAKAPRGVFELDQKKLLAGFDEAARTAKFKEAYALLLEANELDPPNTEVLLHMAQALIVLTPDDPGDEQRILYRIRALLSAPKDDIERFRLAQATFLLATHTDQLEVNTLSDARAMFEKLGRTEWVRHCGDLLRAGVQLSQQQSTSPGPQPASPYGPQPTAPYRPQPTPAPMPPQAQAGFQPVGQWQIHVSDALGSVMHLQLYPNGTFQCTQQAGPYGLSIQAAGQWLFNPYNRMLQIQGLVNGFQPFMLGIAIQSQQGNQYYGVGSDGYGYVFSRA